MSLIWNDDARLEFIEAASYYAQIDIDLGERFVALSSGRNPASQHKGRACHQEVRI